MKVVYGTYNDTVYQTGTRSQSEYVVQYNAMVSIRIKSAQNDLGAA